MQHATSISAEEQYLHMAAYGPSRQSEASQSGPVDLIRSGVGAVKDGVWFVLSCLHPSFIKQKYVEVRDMTWKERLLATAKLSVNVLLLLLQFVFTICWTFLRFIYMMMRGDSKVEQRVRTRPSDLAAAADRRLSYIGGDAGTPLEESPQTTGSKIEAFGLDITREEGEDGAIKYKMTPHKKDEESSGSDLSGEELEGATEVTDPTTSKTAMAQVSGKSALNGLPGDSVVGGLPGFEDDLESELARLEREPPLEIEQKGMELTNWVLSLCARNFYNFKLIALFMAFTINFILLFFRVMHENGDDGDDADTAAAAAANSTAENGTAAEGSGEEDEAYEWVTIADNVGYLGPLLRILTLSHAFVAFAMMVAYYCLKVPLVLFKREKEIARSLEFEGMWIVEQPSDDIRGLWDKLVISTRSFPDKYWDKFVKKKVRQRYAEQYDYDQISNLLGMDNTGSLKVKEKKPSLLPEFLENVDWQYELWKWGIIFTDNSFLYLMWYFLLSVCGNFNPFFYAAHLMDVTVCVKALGTILQSVTHNGKQLVLTVMLTSIVVYLYTVIAFSFFRKFYASEGEEGETDYKCHDMATCFVFHLYKGVRAGGGIGDEIEPPDGDPNEVYRILFDITFFFFVIIILLAIIQGLIIDAFGELRGQLEQVKEDLESSCFICGIGKDYFDKVPHGFETHVMNEHNFANYMFFLMHLINKPDTEYTGQETYVWNLYQQRCWEFIPVGDCFRKQYEDELMAGSS